MSFLEEIIASTRARLPHLPAGEPASAPPSLSAALRVEGQLSVLAEVKRKSPSRGVLQADALAGRQAGIYARAGAAAISVLTEPTRFGGSLADLEEVCATVEIPVLMKDFVIDPRQVRAAALLGASAVLVLVRILEGPALDEILSACREHGLDGLVECHSKAELARAGSVQAQIVGINNRDLDTLAVDRRRALELVQNAPEGCVVVAESGYSSPLETRPLRGHFDAVLMGSALMTATDPAAFIREVVSCR